MSNNDPINVLITLPVSEDLQAALRSVSPRVRLVLRAATRVDEIDAETWGKAEVLYTDRLTPDPALAPALRWVQFNMAGIDFASESALLKKPGLTATTLSGAGAPHVAEFALAMLLALSHRHPDLYAGQQRAEWPRDRWTRYLPHELRGSTVGLVGYGSIGRELARLLQPFQVIILAAKRDVMHPEDNGYIEEGLGDPQGELFTRLYPYQALKSMFKDCDFVVNSLPLTAQTRGLIGAEELRALKPGAFFVDVGRGGVVDVAALAQALDDHHLGGAALDVFPEEPLPAASPLWRAPNLILSPHVAGISPHYTQRALRMFTENLRRYSAGEALLNVFDPERGY